MEVMKEKFNKIQLFLIVFFASLIGGVFIYLSGQNYSSQVDNIPFANSFTVINGVVERSLPVKGSVKIWFKGGTEILIHAGYNYNYSKNELSWFLQKNDSIAKKTNSDVILIYRENKEYIFLLNKNIEKRYPR